MDDFADLPVASLRRLARGLLYDRSAAEDIVQEAWLAALRQSIDRDGLGPWMFGAVRKLAIDKRRAEASRKHREQVVSRVEAQPGAADLLAQIEVLRRVLAAVERLDEPYRSAIGLRYFDDLAPREIARRQRLPVNTVRTHVRRGLEHLRRDLDGVGGADRRTLMSALAPLAGPLPWLASVAKPVVLSKRVGALIVKKKTVLALAVLLFLGLSWIAREWMQETRVPATPTEPLAISEPIRAATRADDKARAQSQDAATTKDEPSRAAVASGAWVLRGRALRRTVESYPNARLLGRVQAIGAAPSDGSGSLLIEQHFEADENGEFAWAMDPPTRLVLVTIHSDMPGVIIQESSDYFALGDEPPPPWTVRLYPVDCTLRGALRAEDGSPIVHARLVDGYWKREVGVDPAGRFEIRVPSTDGTFRLRIIADGYAQSTITLSRLDPGEKTLPDVILQPEARISGRVLGDGGTPIEGASVVATYPYEQLPAVTTGADGTFSFGTIDPAIASLELTARKAGWVPAIQRFTTAEMLGPVIEMQMERGVRVSGRVVSTQQLPVADAVLAVSYWPPNWEPASSKTWSDDRGEFQIENVARGTQSIWVYRSMFPYRGHRIEVPSSGEELDGVEIVLEPGQVLTGEVKSPSGDPLPFSSVYIDSFEGRGRPAFVGAQTVAGPDGRFELHGVPSDAIKIGASARGFARHEQRLDELDRSNIVLTPVPEAILTGRVLDAATGRPVPAFRVRASFSPLAKSGERPPGIPVAWGASVPFDRPDGVWVLRSGLEAGKLVRIEIEAEGSAPALLDPVATSVEQIPDANTALLFHETLVRGGVVEADTDAPVVGARIRAYRHLSDLRSAASRYVAETKTTSGGRFEFKNLASGSISIAVELDGFGTLHDGPFEIAGSAPIDRRVELIAGGGARVSGRLLDLQGRAIPGQTVSMYALDNVGDRREWTTETGADGAYSIRGLEAGSYHLRWTRKRGPTAAYDLLQLVRLETDEVKGIDLRPTGSATIRGRIEFDGALPTTIAVTCVPLIQERLDDSPSAVHWARSARGCIAENGAFELNGLEAGQHSAVVHFVLADGSSASGSSGLFELTDHAVVDVLIQAKRH
jgi:RNA polymerase sigma-70 factor (ECF subfamily)